MFRNLKSIFKVIFISCIFLSLTGSATAEEIEVTLNAIQKTIAAVEKYDYGQSREDLVNFSELVRMASNQNKLLPEIEDAMLNLLESDATFATKQFICKELSLIGTQASVKTLNKLLMDEKTADIALYALERIPDPEVDKVLRKAAGKTKGRVKIGIINTLGQRKDFASMKVFKKAIKDNDPIVSEAAIAAVGKLGTIEAADLLTKQLAKASSEDQKISIMDALLNTANEMRSEDEQLANSLYQGLYEKDKPLNVRTAALRGLIVTLGDDASLMIKQAVQEEDLAIKSTAIALIRELPEGADVADVIAAMPVLEPGLEVQLLAAIMDRGEKKHADAARKSLNSNDEAVRIAALKALIVLGDAKDVTTIADKAANTTGPEKETAREALYRLSGPKVDDTILAEIVITDVKVKRELIRSVGHRPIPTATKTMLSTAKDDDRNVRTESLKSLGVIAQPESLPSLIDLLVSAETSAEIKEAQKTVSLVSQKIEDKSAQSDAILMVLPGLEDPKVYGSLLEVLGGIGSPKSLPVLQKSIKSKKAEIRLSAIRASSDWPNGDPMTDLLPVAQKSKDETERILALRGYIGLVKKSELDDAGKVAAYKSAFDLAEQINEKRQILSGLSEIETIASLEMMGEQLDNPDLKAEAEVGIMSLRRGLAESHPQKLKILLKKIVETTEDERIRSRAKDTLDQLN
ncbi:HEAT repeat domain-containing protein [candidate division KSB1 bacterium]|nr:HEAT repeat domain-containing protein [candidate division KSB1 bacterium]